MEWGVIAEFYVSTSESMETIREPNGAYGGTGPKFCRFHKWRGWRTSLVEPTKLRSCTSVMPHLLVVGGERDLIG